MNATHSKKIWNYFAKEMDKLSSAPTTKPIRPVRIRYKGQFVILPSKKTLWRRMGDAKSAFRNYFDQIFCRFGQWFRYDNTRGSGYEQKPYLCALDGQHYSWEEYEIIQEDMYQKMLSLVEFVYVNE